MVRFLGLALLAVFPFGFANAASFDCGKASSPNEIRICNNATLSKLDSTYGKKYSRLLKISKDKTTVKRDARIAFKKRETQCKDDQCLLGWYGSRIALVESAINKVNEASRSNEGFSSVRGEFHQNILYQWLNIRTFRSSFGQQLKADCRSFLTEFFPKSSMEQISKYSLRVRNESRSWTITHWEPGVVRIEDVILNGSYNKIMDIPVSYSSDSGTWNADETYIRKPSTCKVLQSDLDHRYFNGDYKKYDAVSVGVLDLHALKRNTDVPISKGDGRKSPRPYYKSTTPIYGKINGPEIGSMYVSLTDDGVEGSYASVWFLDKQGFSLADPQLFNEGKYHPAMLTFGEKNGWHNLSGDSDQPIWINANTTSSELISTYSSNEELVMQADYLDVRSAHRMRSGPSTQFDIQRVLQSYESVTLYPLAMKGDWLKVHYVSPELYREPYSKEKLAKLGDEYTQQIGWIKWRNDSKETNVYLTDLDFVLE